MKDGTEMVILMDSAEKVFRYFQELLQLLMPLMP